MSHSAASQSKSKSNGHSEKDQFSSSDDDDDESIHAPIQLKIEFVNSIMFRQWALAKKLCQFMLMYEPDNSEAKQYAPLIDYMLAQEEDGSSSSDDDSSDDEESGDSSSSSSSNEEEKSNDTAQSQTPKPVNASFTKQCTHHK